MAKFYDAIIIGSGPAGLTAALYLGRAGQKCVLLEKEFPGGYTAKIAEILSASHVTFTATGGEKIERRRGTEQPWPCFAWRVTVTTVPLVT